MVISKSLIAVANIGNFSTIFYMENILMKLWSAFINHIKICFFGLIPDKSMGSVSMNDFQECFESTHYNEVIMGVIASQITNLTIVYSAVYSDADQRKHQSSASLAFVRGIHRGPVNSPHKWPVTRKMFPFDDVIITVRLGKHVCRRQLCPHLLQ